VPTTAKPHACAKEVPSGHSAESGHRPLPLAERWLRINETRLAGVQPPVALAA